MNPNTPDTRKWLANYMRENRAATTQRIYDDFEKAFAVTDHTPVDAPWQMLREPKWKNRIRQAVRELKECGTIRSVKHGLWMLNDVPHITIG